MTATVEEKRRLKWVIGFANTDLARMGEGDFLKLLVELKENPWLVASTLLFKDPLKDLLPDLVIPKDTPETRKWVKSIQGRVKRILEKIYEAKDNSRRDLLKTKFSYTLTLQAGKGQFWLGPIPNLANDMFSVALGGGKWAGKHGVELEVADLLYRCAIPLDDKGFERNLDILQKCQRDGCGNFFVRLYEKDKIYCSEKCAWRVYSQAKRNEMKGRRITPKKE